VDVVVLDSVICDALAPTPSRRSRRHILHKHARQKTRLSRGVSGLRGSAVDEGDCVGERGRDDGAALGAEGRFGDGGEALDADVGGEAPLALGCPRSC
jgi:hypothetical protein